MSRWYVDDKVTILLLTCLAWSQSADLRGSGQCRLPSPGGQSRGEAAPLMWYISLLSSNNVHVYLVSNIVIFDWICQLISPIPSVEEPSGSACPVTRILKQENVDLFIIIGTCFLLFWDCIRALLCAWRDLWMAALSPASGGCTDPGPVWSWCHAHLSWLSEYCNY